MSAQDNLKRRYRLYDAPKPLLPVELFKEAHKARGLALLRGQAATEHRHRDDADLRSTGDSQDQATKPQPQRSAEQILDVARPGTAGVLPVHRLLLLPGSSPAAVKLLHATRPRVCLTSLTICMTSHCANRISAASYQSRPSYAADSLPQAAFEA